jgi:seryl-tRNA synthetase
MIDIQFIRDNPEVVKTKTEQKGYKVDIDKLLSMDNERKVLLKQVEVLRQARNENASRIKAGQPDQALIDEGKSIKISLAEKDELLRLMEADWLELLRQIPNIVADDVPIGDEKNYKVVSSWGETKTGAVDHLDYAIQRGWLDFERGAKVAGNKFYFLKGDLALLENAILQFALNLVIEKGFNFMTVPHMVNSRISTGAGFAPRTSEQSDEYFIENEDLTLIATAEIPLTGYHADEVLNEADLPLKYTGFSPCYRKEAGAYGKFTRGLFRVHQFNKLEMYAFVVPEKSVEMHEEIRSVEEEIWRALKIPYRVINIASGDLGAPAAKKYDVEYWSPVDEDYHELTSCSNCTDYQTRNLNIRYKRANGEVDFLHSLNGTAVAMARTLVAIIENFQLSDDKLQIPEALRTYMGGREAI